MHTVNKLIPGSRGLAAVLLKRAASVELRWDVRSKSRFDAVDSQGRVLGVFLPPGTVLRGGDALVAEDGSLIKVVAAAQPVLKVSHCAQHGGPVDLLRAAYHLGQRHAQIELQANCLLLQPDAGLAEWLRGMHLIVDEQESVFEPEAPTDAAGPAHAHGPGCGHDHGESHRH